MDFRNSSAVILFFLVVSFNVSHIQTSETLQKGYKARIIGSTVVSSMQDYPYNVYIHRRMGNGSGKAISCGGAIIGVKWILTAGHCLPSDTSVQNMIVFVGSKQRIKGKPCGVKRAIQHPNFERKVLSANASYYLYDYMILELSKNLKYSQQVQKIDIGSDADIATGQKAILTGYGRTSNESGAGTIQNHLLYKGKFNISSYSNCHDIVSLMDIYEFCARKEGSSALMGDSGSPLVTKSGSKLIGVMSRGQKAPDGGRIDIYCSVPYEKKWIQNTMAAKNR